MDQIVQFIRPIDLFDSQTLTILTESYDKAVVSLHDRGQPLIVRETMAIRMFNLAAMGERDPEALAQGRARLTCSRIGGRPAAHQVTPAGGESPGLLALSILFAAIYKVLPDRELQWRDVMLDRPLQRCCSLSENPLLAGNRQRRHCLDLRRCRWADRFTLMDILLGSDVLLGAEVTKSYANRHGSSRKIR